MAKKHEELIDILTKDHKEVKSLFEKLLKEEDPDNREKMVKKIHQEIIPHMAGEEAALYPALKNTDKGREIALESLEEHQVAQKVLRELIGLPGNLENFQAKGTVLQELVSHHIEEEESEVFKAFKKEIGSSEAGDILDKFQEEKSNTKESMKQPAIPEETLTAW